MGKISLVQILCLVLVAYFGLGYSNPTSTPSSSSSSSMMTSSLTSVKPKRMMWRMESAGECPKPKPITGFDEEKFFSRNGTKYHIVFRMYPHVTPEIKNNSENACWKFKFVLNNHGNLTTRAHKVNLTNGFNMTFNNNLTNVERSRPGSYAVKIALANGTSLNITNFVSTVISYDPIHQRWFAFYDCNEYQGKAYSAINIYSKSGEFTLMDLKTVVSDAQKAGIKEAAENKFVRRTTC